MSRTPLTSARAEGSKSGSEGFEQGEVGTGFGDFVLDQQHRFVTEERIGGKDEVTDVAQHGDAIVPEREILRHAADDGIGLDDLASGVAGQEEREGARLDFLQAEACGAATVQGAAGGEHVLLHHVVVGPAQCEHDFRFGGALVPYLLQQRGDRRIGLDEVGELVHPRDASRISRAGEEF